MLPIWRRAACWVFIAAMAVLSLTPLAVPLPVQAAVPPELERTTLVTGLNQPTAFRFLPDGRILIAEKQGAIKVYANGQVQDQPMITLAVLPTDNDEERGLLGIEPDPDFAQNGYLYVSYTTTANYDRLSRITVTGNVADPASEVVLWQSDQLGNIYHHGGEVRFGPDGKVYWAMGMNTNNSNSQNLSNIHGKILRLNKDGSVPADNPFVNTPNAVTPIWAYGLRNPFRFNFAPNGALLAGDVGGDAWEELNLIQSGGNYGWPLAEGTCSGCPYINPVYTYAHTPAPAKAGSITSVMVYTGTTLPEEYRNKVFIADYTLGFIKYLTFDPTYSSFISEQTFDSNAGTVVQLDQGPDGNIYQLNIYPGELTRIGPSGGNRTPVAKASATPTAGLAPLAVAFSAEGSADPDGVPLTYAWDFGDGTSSTEANPAKTYATNGAYNAKLTVSDGVKSAGATVKITVGDRPPTAMILNPASGAKYNAGDTISFAGAGSDPEDGALPGSAMAWTVDFHHADHKHPFRDSMTGSGGSFTIPTSADNGPTTWYRIHLTVTDSAGLTDSKFVDIYPNLVNISWSANFPDAKFTLDGVPKTGGLTEQAVVGTVWTVGAPSPQYVTGGQYHFAAWSDGGGQTHQVTIPPTDSSYQVTFDKYLYPPSPWQTKDIGAPTLAGYTAYQDGVYTMRGGGGDIWGDTDEFHYMYQALSGDGEIVTRVTAQSQTDDWAKSGVMIKETATKGAKYALLAVTPGNGLTFQHNFNGESGSGTYAFPNAWLKLKRAGDVFSAYQSTDGVTWSLVGQADIAMETDVTVGLAVCSHKYNELNTTVFDNVSVAGQEWQQADVGAPALAGSDSLVDGVHTVRGGGTDIWGEADQFHYTYQELTGDGEIIARVTSLTGSTDGWAKAGVMVKESSAAGAPYALMAVTPGNGANFQYNFDSNAEGGTYSFPNAWVRLKRSGTKLTGYISADGANWRQVGVANIAMPNTVTMGLFVSSHNGGQLATATFDKVKVSHNAIASSGLPAPWVSSDVGAPRLSGSAYFADGVFTVDGAGNDIWDATDEFQFVHQPLVGDGEIVARVRSQDGGTDGWAKSGVMIKGAAVAGSPYALLAATPAHGLVLQYGYNQNVAAGSYSFPNAWLKLVRTAGVIRAYVSTDGVLWANVGSATGVPDEAEIGLFVTSHNGSKLNTSTFDNVSVIQ